MSAPLAGITVLDLSAVGPGSRCTALLADLGATVIKVGAPASQGRIDPVFYAYGAGRGTKKIRLDLRAPEGRGVFLRLCEGNEVVVESFRPGVAARLGIGYDDVRAGAPSVVYCSVTGYGQDGPDAQWAGHDLNYLALGGFLALQGRRADGGPAIPGATVADSAGGGFHAALSIVAALLRRATTGEGAFLDVSTTEGVLSLMSLQVDEFLATGNEPMPGGGLLTGGRACYEVYPTRDGKWLSVAAIEPAFFKNLCAALGCEEWVPFQNDAAKQDEIRASFAAAFATRDRGDWITDLASKDTCVAPVNSIAEVTTNRHLRARGAFTTYEHEGKRYEQVASVIAGSTEPQPVQAGTDAVLRDAGYSADEVAALRESGVIE